MFSDYAMADFDILMEAGCHIFTRSEVILSPGWLACPDHWTQVALKRENVNDFHLDSKSNLNCYNFCLITKLWRSRVNFPLHRNQDMVFVLEFLVWFYAKEKFSIQVELKQPDIS